MNSIKYLAGISIVGLILILSANVSAMAQITVGDAIHNFTVVPGQDADITLPIMVKNASDNPIKGLQFNVTFNASMINITNITKVDVVNVLNAQRTELYNKYCNGTSASGSGILGVWCFFMNTTLTTQSKTNASVMFAKVKNLGNDKRVLRILFASHKKLTGDVKIGEIKMHVKGMSNYFNTSYTLPLNITVEKMGENRTNYVINDSSQSQTHVRVNALMKACRGDADKNGEITTNDGAWIYMSRLDPRSRFYLNLTSKLNLTTTSIRECLDVDGDGEIGTNDGAWIYMSGLDPRSRFYLNISKIKY